MNRARAILLLLHMAVLPGGVSGLRAQDAQAFRPAVPGYEFAFPRDHGSHPEYRTEWWYFTGHLRTESGRKYGFEVTFFRVGIVPDAVPQRTAWDLRHVMPAHFAITDVTRRKFRYYEKLNRASKFTAGAAVGRLDTFNEGWSATTLPDGTWRLVAAEGEDSIDLRLRALKQPAVHGENGVSIKAPIAGYASHYYSMTRLEVTGIVNGETSSGTAWMDHEFGSSALRENQQGWDWFSIQLDNETEIMLYVIRRTDGTPDVTSSGSVVTSDGRVIPITRDAMKITPLSKWRSPKNGAVYPMGWTVELPALNVRLTLRPVMNEQELITTGSTRITYWEGAVQVVGTFAGTPVRGESYVEMTGYDRRFVAPK